MGIPKYNLVLCFVLIFPLSLFSCVTEMEETPSSGELISTAFVPTAMGMMEEMDLVVLSLMQQDFSQLKIVPFLEGGHCPGAVVSKDEKQKKITLDYGEGCVSQRGIEMKGLLTIAYTQGILIKGAKMDILFESFYLNGQRIEGMKRIENLGFEATSKSLRFASTMENLKVSTQEQQVFLFSQSYIRDFHFPNEETGFRIYLTGSGEMETAGASKLTYKIVKPLLFMQECMVSGVAEPKEGSIEISTDASNKVLVDFNLIGC